MQPQAYNRATDFTDRTGDDTDNSAINLEFDAAALSINEIRDNLKLIQRDDGALVNGIVTADALDDSAFDAVQASVNAATVAAQNSANSALTSAITANNAKDAAVIAKTSAETARDSSGLNATNAAASAIAANNSSSAAAASEAAALISKNAAQASQTAAAASAASASGSASTSTAQAGIATTKAGESAASQLAAAASEAAALASKNAAATSEANALSSKNAAATSQTSAAASAATSTTKASEASSSAATATTKASEASTSATNSATSATNSANSAASALAIYGNTTTMNTAVTTATSSAATATTKASEAATSATNAAASATNAASSASTALTAQSATETARDATLAALDNFDDRYLGQKSSDPTVDNDGNPLTVGALYFNTTGTGTMKVYEGTSWVAAYASLSGALLVTNNLSDLSSASAARTNLGLGSLATKSSVAIADLSATGTPSSSSYLRGDNTWSIPVGGVTAVTATSPVVSSGGSTPAISIPAATASVNGYMTSTYASKLDGIAAGATNVTNTNQLTNGAGFITASGNAATATTASTANALATGNNYQVNSLGVGTGATGTAGEIRATNNITAYYSDERLKTKIGNIENPLDKVKQIETMVYHANEAAVALGYDASIIEVGVTAQSVQRVMPQTVAPAPIDDKYLTVRYERLVPLLIEAVKELEAQVSELKGKK